MHRARGPLLQLISTDIKVKKGERLAVKATYASTPGRQGLRLSLTMPGATKATQINATVASKKGSAQAALAASEMVVFTAAADGKARLQILSTVGDGAIEVRKFPAPTE